MSAYTLFVQADPSTAQLQLLKDLPSEVTVIVAKHWSEVRDELATIDAVLAWDPGSKESLAEMLISMPKLRWIHTRSAGLDTFLSPELKESSVVLTNAKGVFAESLAEFVIGAVLYFAKDFPRMTRNQRQKRWSQFKVQMVTGKRLSIFGYGAIGKRVAEKAKAIGMKVAISRRSAMKPGADPSVDKIFPSADLKGLAADSDYFVVTAPLTPETKGSINSEILGALPPHAVFINIGRGGVVDEPALIRGLSDGKIRGAALDVFSVEPLPAESPLYTLENVILSPHCADQTETWLEETMGFFVENALRFARGEPLHNIVDKQLGY